MAEEETILTASAPEVSSDEKQSDSSPETIEASTPTESEASAAANNETEGNAEETESEVASAPETYEVFELPENFDMNEETLGEYHTFAKENNLTQEQAQRGVDMVAQMKQAEMNQWVEQQKSWVDDAKSDTEFGGDKFDQSISVAVKARDSFGTPEFNEMLDSSGLGNHPEMIRFLSRVGKQISEDGVVVGGSSISNQTREAVLYPSMQN
jgi:hypothetical protein|tara:strand:- start:471 stop:1103 length:633 start_codon:yes stop_codon:yes gene_type:complete